MNNNIIAKECRDIAATFSRLASFFAGLCIALGVGAPIPAKAMPNCDEKIKAFLATPDERTLEAVSGASGQECWEVIGFSNVFLNSLIRSVEQGNRWAAQYLVGYLRKLDGGNLEDSLRALGQFSDHSMAQLLRFRKDGRLSEHGLVNALTMLPISLNNSLCGNLSALTVRRFRVMWIPLEDLAEAKAMALKAIDGAASKLIKSSGCDGKAKNLLTAPNEQALKAVSEADDKKCWMVIGCWDNNFYTLVRSVEQGNRWAAQYLAEHLKELDGGYLGDSLRALGQFSEHEMEQFLCFKKNDRLTENQFKNALTNLPLSLSDNLDGQLDALKARRERVMQITRDDLTEERDMALKVIDDAVSNLKLIIQKITVIGLWQASMARFGQNKSVSTIYSAHADADKIKSFALDRQKNISQYPYSLNPFGENKFNTCLNYAWAALQVGLK